MPNRFEIRHLRAFLVLAEELHFSRAADRLFLTQPGLTQTIRQLESALGLRLFSRTTRQVTLSSAGEALAGVVREAAAALDTIETEARRIAREESGRLTVGYQIGTGVELIPAIVKQFECDHPEFTIELQEYDFAYPAAGLDTGESDIAFLRPPVGVEGLRLVTLYQEPRLAGLPSDHPLVARPALTVADLLPEPIIAAPGPGVWRDYWLLADHRTESPTIALESSTFDSELQYVAAGRGIVITCQASRSYYNRPGVVFREVEDLTPCDVALGWVERSTHPAVRPFLATVTTMVEEQPDI